MSNFLQTFQTAIRNLLFRPSDGFYFNTNIIGSKEPVYIDTDKPYELYNSISELRQVVDKKATMFSNMEIKLVDKQTKEAVEDKELSNLLQNPNVFQSMNKWLRSYKTQEQIYGNQFMYANKPSSLSKYPVSLINISPKYLTPVLTGKVFDQVNIDGVISKYKYKDGSTERYYETKDILYTKIDDLDNPVIGTSPLTSLVFPLSNTKLAYQYRNVIMAEKGAIGILSNRSSDQVGPIALKKEEKDAINKMYTSDYGIGNGQKRVIITNNELNWQPMTYPTKDLLLFEEVDANKLTIVDHFGLNINIFSNKNATFENVKNALIQCYQDTIIPEADEFMQALTKFLNIDKRFELNASFDHVQILQQDKEREENVLSKRVASINQLVSIGVINPIQAQQMLATMGVNIDPSTAPNIIDRLNQLSPLVSNNVIGNLTVNELRSMLGLGNVEGGDVIQSQAQPNVSFNAG